VKRLTEWIDEDTAVPVRKAPVKESGHTKCMKKLAEYEDLEEQGLLLRIPCKAGDNVYCTFDDEISKREVAYFTIGSFMTQITLICELSTTFCSLKEFGKNIFLTREEAKKALEKRKADLK